MRVSIYARFSSDLQDVRSITDQIATTGEHARRQGWLIVAKFSDAAISGSSLHNRPGLLDLMVAANRLYWARSKSHATRAFAPVPPNAWPRWVR